MIDRGVYLPCSQFEALFVSAAHTEADIDATIAAAREVLRKVKSEIRSTKSETNPKSKAPKSKTCAGGRVCFEHLDFEF